MMPLEAERESLVEDSFKKQRSGFAALQDMPAKLYGALFLVVLIIFGTTLILSSGGSAESVSNGNANVVIVGRHAVDPNTNTIHFDHPGVKIKAKVTGTSTLNAVLSKVSDAKLVYFHVYCNGIFAREVNTSSWTPGTPVTISNICNLGIMDKTSEYDILIFKETEAQFSDTKVTPNYITFYRFAGDSGMRILPPVKEKKKKIEFLGDSITAGFCNMCQVEPKVCGPKPDHGATCEAQQHFSSSWAHLICEHFQAECHIEAWSGFGMYENCCGGETLMSDIYKRTLATVVSSNPNDPHGTIAANEWDFTKWIPDAVVINLGTNDMLNRRPNNIYKYNATYLNLVVEASKSYGLDTHFFLACGPMSNAYCEEVNWILDTIRRPPYLIKASFLDQRNFLNGTYGPACCSHPSAEVDQAIGTSSIRAISSIMHW